MNFKSFLCVTIFLVMRVNGLMHTQSNSLSREITDKCDLTAGPQCSSDCSKILACASRIETPILRINCTESTPYCENGRCVATRGNCAMKMKAENTSFLCTSPGTFPEPSDCTRSHSCSEVGSQSIVSVCPRGTIFDSRLKLCVPRPSNYESVCQKISCDGVTNDFLTFPSNPTFYAYCFISATGVQHTYMYKCDDEVNKVFDVITKKCRFNCKAIGYFADPLDCSSYYICNGLQFASRHVHCPPNYYFNGTVCLNSKAHCPIGSIVNVTTTSPVTVASNSMDEMPVMPDPTTEEEEVTTDATVLASNESTTMEESPTPTHGQITQQTVALQMDMPTKKPSIWKHMGLISVRVGRFLNIV